MTFLPMFGDLRKMCALDCGTITFMNEIKSQFLDSLMDVAALSAKKMWFRDQKHFIFSSSLFLICWFVRLYS